MAEKTERFVDEQAARVQHRAWQTAVAVIAAGVAATMALAAAGLALAGVIVLVQPYTGVGGAMLLVAGIAVLMAAVMFFVARAFCRSAGVALTGDDRLSARRRRAALAGASRDTPSPRGVAR